MSRIQLAGLDGSNPLGFLAALGLLRILSKGKPHAKLGFSDDGLFRAFLFLDGIEVTEADVTLLIEQDATSNGSGTEPWRFTYTKAATKKQGPQEVADLKPPPEAFKNHLKICIEAWLQGNDEAAAYAAASALFAGGQRPS